MNLIPRRLIAKIFRSLGYHIESIKGNDDAELYSDFPLSSLKNKSFLNIGAGTFNHKFWTNVDYGSKQYAKVQNKFVELNLMEIPKFPFENDSVELIYSSHTIEHVNDKAVKNLIEEAFRILKVGGIFRITCPDANLLLNSVKNNVFKYWAWRNEWFEKKFEIKSNQIEIEDFLVREISTARCRFFENEVEPLYPKMIREKINQLDDETFLQWMVEKNTFDNNNPQFHINYWTFEKLEKLFKDAGFNTIYHSGFGQSLSPPLTNTKIFDNTHPKMSLYVEARKE
ncbi:MAG: methyltransferase domain-containing protein [Candidatus Thermoplasmatota archaeon]|nr:methyltransferase domain-containing protein [Candidatus Thermoplasmatota archaeon]